MVCEGSVKSRRQFKNFSRPGKAGVGAGSDLSLRCERGAIEVDDLARHGIDTEALGHMRLQRLRPLDERLGVGEEGAQLRAQAGKRGLREIYRKMAAASRADVPVSNPV